MASSNRHWPSMFKSKPCNTTHHQWQHDINPSLMSSCQRPPYASVGEERSPDPKPRWNPKPEQIRILEAIFNSGMVNPPRDEIRKIRAQLQEYGQVGDANVFYWFQNRKSRSKHKQRHLQTPKSHQAQSQFQFPPVTSTVATFTAPSSSSSSSEKSSPKKKDKMLAMGGINMIDVSNSPTASVNNQTYFQTHGDFSSEPFFFPVQQIEGNTSVFSQGFCFSELSNNVQIQDHQLIGSSSGSLLIGELLNQEVSKEEEEKLKLHQQLSYALSSSSAITTTTTTTTAAAAVATSITHPIPSPTSTIDPTTINQIQGVGVGESSAMGPAAAARSTVFINDVAFEVFVGPFNVREAFGDEAVLLHSSGQPVLTNHWGVTFQSLQPGAFYYLV